MGKLQKLIDDKANAAKYMSAEIEHICKNIDKRSPGSEGEKKACEYMADVLKNDCGCEKVAVESYKENPGSFYGWIYFTVTFVFLGIISYFFLPIVGIVLIALGFLIMGMQFIAYKKFIDCFFPEKTGHNVTAIKSCSGEVKRRIFFNGHPDAAWEWPVNYHFGGIVYALHIVISVVGALYYLGISVARLVCMGIGYSPVTEGTWMILGLVGLVFAPFLAGMYKMWDKKVIVDGANDNLTGCYMGIALLKAMKDEGIELENTEVGVILSGSEEAGLRGAKAWCEQHKGEFKDVETIIMSYDTIHEEKYLQVNDRDLNDTVKADKAASDLFVEAAKELGLKCGRGKVPMFGGATDSAAFNQAGFRAAGITALNHNLQDYYHTRRDTYDNLDLDCLANCYAISVRALEKFDGE